MNDKLKKLAGTIIAMPIGQQAALLLILVSLIWLIVSGISWYLSPSKNEKQVREAQANTIRVDSEANVAAREVEVTKPVVKEREQKAREAVKEARKARDAKVEGTTPESANRARCAAYPESKECN